MTPNPPPDRVQREIEELLDKLDTFVPEERFVSKIKKRRKEAAGPNVFQRSWTRVRARFSRVTLGHVMLLGLALLLLGQFAPGLFMGFARWAVLAGIVMTLGAFLLSVLGGWDSRRPIAGGGEVEKRWRGQTISYSQQPSRTTRLKGWFRNKRGR